MAYMPASSPPMLLQSPSSPVRLLRFEARVNSAVRIACVMRYPKAAQRGVPIESRRSVPRSWKAIMQQDLNDLFRRNKKTPDIIVISARLKEAMARGDDAAAVKAHVLAGLKDAPPVARKNV